jgi:hypothetical protein
MALWGNESKRKKRRKWEGRGKERRNLEGKNRRREDVRKEGGGKG